jgi:hypothetical protein
MKLETRVIYIILFLSPQAGIQLAMAKPIPDQMSSDPVDTKDLDPASNQTHLVALDARPVFPELVLSEPNVDSPDLNVSEPELPFRPKSSPFK